MLQVKEKGTTNTFNTESKKKKFRNFTTDKNTQYKLNKNKINSSNQINCNSNMFNSNMYVFIRNIHG